MLNYSNAYLENAFGNSVHLLTEKCEGPYGFKWDQNPCRSSYSGTSSHEPSYSPFAGTWPLLHTTHMLLCKRDKSLKNQCTFHISCRNVILAL